MNSCITRDDVKRLIESGNPLVIIEALPKQYFDTGHLPGAINIPHDEVPAKAADLIPDRDTMVVVYCANADCRNSRVAGESLREMGFTKVFEYTGGKKDWKDAGLPFENEAAK